MMWIPSCRTEVTTGYFEGQAAPGAADEALPRSWGSAQENFLLLGNTTHNWSLGFRIRDLCRQKRLSTLIAFAFGSKGAIFTWHWKHQHVLTPHGLASQACSDVPRVSLGWPAQSCLPGSAAPGLGAGSSSGCLAQLPRQASAPALGEEMLEQTPGKSVCTWFRPTANLICALTFLRTWQLNNLWIDFFSLA